MRNLILTVVAIVALAACGASSKETTAAKTARYRGDKLAIFNAMKEAVAAKYTIEKSDETALGLNTTNRWYTPEGLAAAERDMRDVPDKSLGIMFVCTMLPDGDNWVVKVEPKIMRYFAGRPNPDQLKVDDPSIPGWAIEKVDALSVAVNEALKQFEVPTGGPQMVPAGKPGDAAAQPKSTTPNDPAATTTGGGY